MNIFNKIKIRYNDKWLLVCLNYQNSCFYDLIHAIIICMVCDKITLDPMKMNILKGFNYFNNFK